MNRITTALHTASHLSQIDLIDSSIVEGISINAKDNKGCTPLHLAITGDDALITINKLLGIEGCQINAQDDSGQTPLHWATGRGLLSVMELLLKHGADIDARDNEERTPLDLAITEYDTDAIEYLLKVGASYSDSMFTAIATEDDDPSMVKLLLPYYYDIDSVRNKNGETFLHAALGSLNEEIPEILLEAEACVNAQCTLLQETALHKALKYRHIDSYAVIIPSLLKRLPDITVKNSLGQSAVNIILNHCEYQELLGKHACKLHAANMFSPSQLNEIVNAAGDFLHTPYHKKCLAEVKYLKSIEIEDVTFYSLLTKSKDSLVRLLRNKNLQNKLTDEFLEKCYTKIPEYRDIFEVKLKQASRRAELVESCQFFFYFLKLPLLPPHCIDFILSFLTRQELISLSKVCLELN